MIIGTGIDIMLISRMSKKINNAGFMERVFSKKERDYIASKGNPSQTAAGLFCAKEAYLKANSMGICDIPLDQIEILHRNNGCPYISGTNGKGTYLSISHMGDIAIAQVIIESEE